MKKVFIIILACSFLLSLIPTTVLAADGENPVDFNSDLKRVSIYTDEEIAKIDELLISGAIKLPPGERVEATAAIPGEGPLLAGRPDINGVTRSRGGIAAGYQLYGGEYKPDWCGVVAGETWSIPNLVDNGKEYMVLHQWGELGASHSENCIVIYRSGSTGYFGTYLSELGGYQDWVTFPASHTVRVYVLPDYAIGSREYDEVSFVVWDLTNGTSWGDEYTLPDTEQIKDVDAALEQVEDASPNSLWATFYNFLASDENRVNVNLAINAWWSEHPSVVMNNVHSQYYYSSNTRGALSQRKTPK
jgi:hypothetical protein